MGKRLYFRGWLLGSVILPCLFVPIAGAAGSSTAEVARGEHIARLVCSACHVVARDQEYPPLLTQPAPSFFDIAGRPGVSAQSLQHFIANTHWDTDKLPMSMPSPMLNRSETVAVSQYILSLRPH